MLQYYLKVFEVHGGDIFVRHLWLRQLQINKNKTYKHIFEGFQISGERTIIQNQKSIPA